ncbi:MAG: ferredoxin [Actinomycetota bacterium]|nr:ferredoxin [Actinomycetota bacterium]
MKVVIDTDRCQGHGQCAVIAPGVFAVGDDEKAHLLLLPGTEVPGCEEPTVDDAIAICPEAALSWMPE